LFRRINILALLAAFSASVCAQFSTCDTTLINAHLNPAGFTRLYVPSEPCSMYFYNPTPMYGITAHLDAINLGVPQLVINNAAENTAVLNALLAQGVFPANADVWMGITDSATTYTWRTFAGQPAPAYTNWEAGEPNNQSPSCKFLGSCTFCTGANAYWCANGEDCAVMYGNGQWLDITCEGDNITHIAVLELNTCPVLTPPRDTAVCSGNPISVTAAAVSGGTAPYTYTWNPGGQTGQTVTITPSSSATYTVEASDKYQCQTDSTFTIAVTSTTPPTIDLSRANTCAGSNDTISLSAVSGTAAYTWSFGTGATMVSGSGGGPYIVRWSAAGTKAIDVTVTDHGCTSTATTTATVSAANAGFALSPTSACAGQDIAVTVTSPSATATYSWNFSGANIVSGAGSGPYSVNWASTGPETVSLTVTDGGCTASNSVNTTISSGLTPAFTLNPSANACVGQDVSVTLTGAVSGTATYTWNFNGGTILSGSGGGPYSISWGSGGAKTIDLTVTDGCTGTASQSITIGNAITADAGADLQLCPGAVGNLGAAPTAGYTYSWSPGLGLSDSTIANPTISIPSNATGSNIVTPYILTVSSGSCQASDTVIVTIYPNINNNFTVSPDSVCAGVNTTVTYSGTASGTATYNWNFSGANIVSGSGVGPYAVNWASYGSQTISLSVADNGCTATQVTNNVLVSAGATANAGTDQTVCSGISVQLGATAAAGTSYSWSPSANLSNAGIADPVFQQNNNGAMPDTNAYMLIASSGGGCRDTAYVTVIVNPTSTVTITPQGATSFCMGDSVVLQTGTALVHYLWSNGDTTASIVVRAAGTYSVTGYDGNGCRHISSQPMAVAISAGPSLSLAANGEQDETCWGTNDGSLKVEATGGTPAYSFIWNTSPIQSSDSATGLAPGSYTVTVTDAAGCIDTASYSVRAAAYLGIVIDSTQNVSCYGRSDGTIYADGTGGTQPYSYVWSNGSTSAAATGLSAGAISVALTDQHGCIADTTVQVTQPPKITITLPDTLVINYGSSQQLGVSVSPPSSGYYYDWSPAASLSCSSCPDPVASPGQTTTYMVTVSEGVSGCSDTASLTLTVTSQNHFYIPNAFSPNGDGINDTLYVSASAGVLYYQMMIWDRWGELVYSSYDIGTGWDGRYKGTMVPTGGYVYMATLSFADGIVYHSKGSITLIK
jgi:gliding motility-associated-like protein